MVDALLKSVIALLNTLSVVPEGDVPHRLFCCIETLFTVRQLWDSLSNVIPHAQLRDLQVSIDPF